MPRAPERLAAVLALGACIAAACRGAAFDPADLAVRHPGLGSAGARALAGLLPYGYPGPGGLWLFSCRWPDRAEIAVALPPDRSPDEDRLLRRALAAWQAALPGIALRAQEHESGEGIALRFEADAAGPRAGEAEVECALEPASLQPGAQVVAARIDSARIALRRAELDVLGRERVHSAEELLGSALHELGHALGFQGHATRDSVLRREVEEVRRAGRRVLAGEPLADAALRALYALPSGAVLAKPALADADRALIEALASAAAGAALRGPWLQVGDLEARVVWRARAGRAHALRLPDWPARIAGRRAAPAQLLPRAAQLVEHSRAAGS